tara:strand:- start:10 stop:336 length:327 start_codon:yes stop_codon:yes gene_type:complete
MGNYLNQKRIVEFDIHDPVKNLWQSVLCLSIEDAIKIKHKFLKYERNTRSPEIDYVMEPNIDFARVCEYAGLNHNMIRRNVLTLFKKMENKEDVVLPWKRLTGGEIYQ